MLLPAIREMNQKRFYAYAWLNNISLFGVCVLKCTHLYIGKENKLNCMCSHLVNLSVFKIRKSFSHKEGFYFDLCLSLQASECMCSKESPSQCKALCRMEGSIPGLERFLSRKPCTHSGISLPEIPCRAWQAAEAHETKSRRVGALMLRCLALITGPSSMVFSGLVKLMSFDWVFVELL